MQIIHTRGVMQCQYLYVFNGTNIHFYIWMKIQSGHGLNQMYVFCNITFSLKKKKSQKYKCPVNSSSDDSSTSATSYLKMDFMTRIKVFCAKTMSVFCVKQCIFQYKKKKEINSSVRLWTPAPEGMLAWLSRQSSVSFFTCTS